MALFGNISSGIQSEGQAAADLISAQGDFQAANAFGQAATLATQDEQIQQESTNIQEVQEKRQIMQTLGSQKAEVASAGFEQSGSSLALMASSAQQGAMTVALTGIQGQILANGYAQQAAAYTAQQDSANAAGQAAQVAGAASAAAGAFQFFGL